jgi:hypothetical protein
MEPSGRNPWQSLANGTASKTAQTSETAAVGCDRLPESFHGKEGVDGSSPSEGLAGSRMVPGVAGIRRRDVASETPDLETIWKRGRR